MKLGHFARDYQLRNLINRRQINVMLREIFNRQDDIKKQIDTKTNILKTKLNDDYYLIKNLN